MALKHHTDSDLRISQQVENSENYVLAFINETYKVVSGLKVLEIGCGEGGVLKPFIDRGCNCVGVDLDDVRIDIANDIFKNEVKAGNAIFNTKNVYDADFVEKYSNHFDLIILKDTIEHVPNQENFSPHLKKILAPSGQIFFGFPPWQMPFGGHQQLCLKKVTSVLPYYHLLPTGIYKTILKLFGEPKGKIIELVEIKETGISIERFERIVKNSGYSIKNKTHFLINPIYKYKFGLKPRKQAGFITHLPYLRNFLTTCVYYTIG
jgi:SAM-dependent methyltransferase